MKLIWSLNHKRAVTQEQVMEIRIKESISMELYSLGVALFELIVVPPKGDPFIVVEKPTHFQAQVFAQEMMD